MCAVAPFGEGDVSGDVDCDDDDDDDRNEGDNDGADDDDDETRRRGIRSDVVRFASIRNGCILVSVFVVVCVCAGLRFPFALLAHTKTVRRCMHFVRPTALLSSHLASSSSTMASRVTRHALGQPSANRVRRRRKITGFMCVCVCMHVREKPVASRVFG